MGKNNNKQTFGFHSFLDFRIADKGMWTNNNDDTKNDNSSNYLYNGNYMSDGILSIFILTHLIVSTL